MHSTAKTRITVRTLQVMESGHEVPITADLDLDTVNLDPFNFAIPDPSYYSGESPASPFRGHQPA